jgi:flagellar protein FliL
VSAAPAPAAAPAAAAAPETAVKKGGKKKLFLIGGVVLVLAAGGGFYYSTRAAAHEEPAAAKEISPKDRGLVSFDPFVANLADEGGRRFVRVTVQLVVGDVMQAAEITETPVLAMQARAIILELLGMQLADALVTPEGKVALRQAIAERVADALQELEVIDVLFSDFVVQF